MKCKMQNSKCKKGTEAGKDSADAARSCFAFCILHFELRAKH